MRSKNTHRNQSYDIRTENAQNTEHKYIAQLNWHSVYCVCSAGWLSNASTTWIVHTSHRSTHVHRLRCTLYSSEHLYCTYSSNVPSPTRCVCLPCLCLLDGMNDQLFAYLHTLNSMSSLFPRSLSFFFILFYNENKTFCPIAKYAKLPSQRCVDLFE